MASRIGRGRKPGSRNKLTKSIADALNPLIKKGTSLVEQVLDGKLPCGVCHGKGKTKYQPKRKKVGGLWTEVDPVESGGKMHERTCQSCYGSGLERLSPAERLRAALDILEYGHAKRKAVEVTGENGGPISHSMTVTFVRPGALTTS